jgi:FlaG/FlaF family flagellin (archaellin)
MVAITVILAAVIGAFALNFADSGQSAGPSVNFEEEFDNSSNNVTVTVTAGDRFDATLVTFTGDVADTGANVSSAGDNWTEAAGVTVDNATVGAGTQVVVGVTGPAYEVDIVFESEDGQESTIIGTLEGPEA